MAGGGLPQALDVERRRRRVAALDDLAAAGAQRIVADDAVNHVAVPPLFQDLARDGKREGVDVIVPLDHRIQGGGQDVQACFSDNARGPLQVSRLAGAHAGEQVRVAAQMAPGHRAGNDRPGRPAIRKELAGVKRLVAGLSRHLLLAGKRQKQQPDPRGQGSPVG